MVPQTPDNPLGPETEIDAGRSWLFHLRSVRGRILIFALLATLVPSIGLSWIFLQQTEQIIKDNSLDEMRGVVSYAAREIDLWMKERVYDLRVFSSSYVLSENLQSLRQQQSPGGARQRLDDYLNLVVGQYPEYERMVVYDPAGQVLVGSRSDAALPPLPQGWWEQLNQGGELVGAVRWDPVIKRYLLVIWVPIRGAQGEHLGAIGVDIHVQAVRPILEAFPVAQTGEVLLLTLEGQAILSSRKAAEAEPLAPLAESLVQRFQARPTELHLYRNAAGEAVLGMWGRIGVSHWALLVEQQRGLVFADVERIRDFTFMLMLVLVVAIALLAYGMGQSIIRPLSQLVRAAGKVTTGDLEVQIPVRRRDELGLTIGVFNTMVHRLRDSRAELERLSVTDDLTGLFNHKYLVDAVQRQIERFQRHPHHGFCLIMADIDHFKSVNDSYGHLVGDEVLRRVGEILTAGVRSVDVAARYGGEEFILVLEDTQMEAAAVLAERIRTQVEALHIESEGKTLQVTLSAGVAEARPEDQSLDLIGRADQALYQAKEQGRNRIVRAA